MKLSNLLSKNILQLNEWMGVDIKVEEPPTQWPSGHEIEKTDNSHAQETINKAASDFQSNESNAPAIIASLKDLLATIPEDEYDIRRTTKDLIAAIIIRWTLTQFKGGMPADEAIRNLQHAKQFAIQDKLIRTIELSIDDVNWQRSI